MKKLIYILSTMLVVGLFTGCTAGGAKFTSVESGPTDKAVVYFYRPNNFQGSALSITIKDNNATIFKIQNGQFIRYLASPGKHKFFTDTMAIDRATELDLEAGKVYYLKTSLSVGLWVGTWSLNRVYEQEALEELKSCKSGTK